MMVKILYWLDYGKMQVTKREAYKNGNYVFEIVYNESEEE